jgi:diamine N-acetyltransferase
MTPPGFSQDTYVVSADLTLRISTPDDAAALGVMLAAIDPWMRYPVPAEKLAAFFAQFESGSPRFSIHLGGELIGCVALRTTWLAGPYIQTFGLSPTAQGRGVGTCVLTFIEAEALRLKARNLWVAASDFNTGALRFYERHGFISVAALPALLQDNRNEVLLRKRLAA